jgi:hypothetical protein
MGYLFRGWLDDVHGRQKRHASDAPPFGYSLLSRRVPETRLISVIEP